MKVNYNNTHFRNVLHHQKRVVKDINLPKKSLALSAYSESTYFSFFFFAKYSESSSTILCISIYNYSLHVPLQAATTATYTTMRLHHQPTKPPQYPS